MENFAQAIVETVREPLLLLDAELRVRSANSSFYQTFQVSPEDTEDRPLYELGNDQWDIPKLRTLLEQILPQGNQVQDFEVEHDFPGIGRRTMLLNARQLRQLNGGPALILLAIEDMTMRGHLQEELKRHRDQLDGLVKERTRALRRANEQLRHDNAVRKQMEESLVAQAARERELNEALKQEVAELDAFTYSVSHDLKEPLRAIEAFSKFALEDCADQLDEQGRDYLIKLANASIRMKTLIDDLLTLSRAFRQPGPPKRIDVGGLVEDIVEDMQLTLDAKGATMDVEKDLPDVLAESTRMRQVFVNLIGNAIKFNESERPHVKIGIRDVEDGRATFYVQDNGIGIDPQYHERIFGIFQRLHCREDYEGTGAGLAVVKRVVDIFGGRIWVESELGAGATFLFTLPLATEATASIEGKAA
jgi:two-component system, chemotaxis family, CheB/CheR fusion protein